jgi:hypothetical protein
VSHSSQSISAVQSSPAIVESHHGRRCFPFAQIPSKDKPNDVKKRQAERAKYPKPKAAERFVGALRFGLLGMGKLKRIRVTWKPRGMSSATCSMNDEHAGYQSLQERQSSADQLPGRAELRGDLSIVALAVSLRSS